MTLNAPVLGAARGLRRCREWVGRLSPRQLAESGATKVHAALYQEAQCLAFRNNIFNVA